MKICIVSKLAHRRGYGSPEEMVYLPERMAYARIKKRVRSWRKLP